LQRKDIRFRPLSERPNKVSIPRDMVDPDSEPAAVVLDRHGVALERISGAILRARGNSLPVILAFGAHAIKNGLGPLLIRLIEEDHLTHLATNGAGVIHDWELAYQGATSEDVRANLADGSFGIWEETGALLNLALAIGAYRDLGYGESVGAMVEGESLLVPAVGELEEAAARGITPGAESAAAAALVLLGLIRSYGIRAGTMSIPHPFKSYGLQAAAYRQGTPFTGHPMFGHDIIYCHPYNRGAAVGICAERDFLTFAGGVSRLGGGMYLSVGSAVMSPMIFEKSLSMARNIARQRGEKIEGFDVVVVDLKASSWDWSRNGEPPPSHPDYYLRYLKTFGRTGGELTYLTMDNRDFFLGLHHFLKHHGERS
jgi:hypothetical protein